MPHSSVERGAATREEALGTTPKGLKAILSIPSSPLPFPPPPPLPQPLKNRLKSFLIRSYSLFTSD